MINKAYYGESRPNPYLRFFQLKRLQIGRKKGIPLIIDNTASQFVNR